MFKSKGLISILSVFFACFFFINPSYANLDRTVRELEGKHLLKSAQATLSTINYLGRIEYIFKNTTAVQKLFDDAMEFLEDAVKESDKNDKKLAGNKDLIVKIMLADSTLDFLISKGFLKTTNGTLEKELNQSRYDIHNALDNFVFDSPYETKGSNESLYLEMRKIDNDFCILNSLGVIRFTSNEAQNLFDRSYQGFHKLFAQTSWGDDPSQPAPEKMKEAVNKASLNFSILISSELLKISSTLMEEYFTKVIDRLIAVNVRFNIKSE